MNTGDDLPPLPDGVLPDGWSDTEFDLDALMGGRVDAVASESMPAPVDGRDEPGEITDGPANGSVLSAMNTTDIRAKLEKAARRSASGSTACWSWATRWAPSRSSCSARRRRSTSAPGGCRPRSSPWCSSASPWRAPKEEKVRAAANLGMQLNKLTNGALKSSEIPRPEARELGFDRGLSGYRVEDLRKAADEMSRGSTAA